MKMDPHLVDTDKEPYYISKTFRIPINTVRRAMKTANNGQPSRSRSRIYAKLVEMKWLVVTVVKGRNKYSQVAQEDRPY